MIVIATESEKNRISTIAQGEYSKYLKKKKGGRGKLIRNKKLVSAWIVHPAMPNYIACGKQTEYEGVRG